MIFPRGIKSGEISFCPLETKKTTFFVKHLLRKCKKLKNPGSARLRCPPYDDNAHVIAELMISIT